MGTDGKWKPLDAGPGLNIKDTGPPSPDLIHLLEACKKNSWTVKGTFELEEGYNPTVIFMSPRMYLSYRWWKIKWWIQRLFK